MVGFQETSGSLPENELEKLADLYKLLEVLLEKSRYFTEDHVTVADFSIITSVAASDLVLPVDVKKFPKLFEWMERMKALPCYQDNLPEWFDLFSLIMEYKAI